MGYCPAHLIKKNFLTVEICIWTLEKLTRSAALITKVVVFVGSDTEDTKSLLHSVTGGGASKHKFSPINIHLNVVFSLAFTLVSVCPLF